MDLRTGDASDELLLREFVSGASSIVNCIDGQRQPGIIDLIEPDPELRFIMLGSTRVHTRFPDERCHAIRELAVRVLERPWRATLVHPSMMYGWRRGNESVRLIQQLLHWRIFPLPLGYPARVQPVHVADVALGLLAVMQRDETIGQELVFAGPQPVSYEDFIRQCAANRSLWLPRLPLFLLRMLAALASSTRLGPAINPMVLTRLTEDRTFPNQALPSLGVTPRCLAEGLRQISEV